MVDIKRIAFCLVFLLIGANSFSSMSETPAICKEKKIAKKESVSRRISDVGKRAMRPFAKFYYGLVGNEKECSSTEILGIRLFTFIVLLASQSMLIPKQASAQRRVIDARVSPRVEVDDRYPFYRPDRSAAESVAESMAERRARFNSSYVSPRVEVDAGRYPFYRSDRSAAEMAERLARFNSSYVSSRVEVDAGRYPFYRSDRSAAEMAERLARFNSNNENSNYNSVEDQDNPVEAQSCFCCCETCDENPSLLGPIPCKNPHPESVCDSCLTKIELNDNRCPMCRNIFNF